MTARGGHLTEVTLSGLRGFPHTGADRIPLAPLTLLYGANSSGKSTVLKGLANLAQTRRLNGGANRPRDWWAGGHWFELGREDLLHRGGDAGFRVSLSTETAAQLDLEYAASRSGDVRLRSVGTRWSDGMGEQTRLTWARTAAPGWEFELDWDHDDIGGVVGLALRLLRAHGQVLEDLDLATPVLLGEQPAPWGDTRAEALVELHRRFLDTRYAAAAELDDVLNTPEELVEALSAGGLDPSPRAVALMALARRAFWTVKDNNLPWTAGPQSLLSQLLDPNILFTVDGSTLLGTGTPRSQFAGRPVFLEVVKSFFLSMPEFSGVSHVGDADVTDSFEILQRYTDRAQGMLEDASEWLDRVRYLGAQRLRPRRTYSASPADRPRLDSPGEEVIPWLVEDADLLSRVNAALTSVAGVQLDVAPLFTRRSGSFEETGLVQAMVGRANSYDQHTLPDVGYGVAQLIPLLANAALGGVLFVEEPEANLHPEAQALLVDSLVGLAGLPNDSAAPRLILETHSEHILQRVLQLVTEGKLSDSNVSILYVWWQGDRTRVRRVRTRDGRPLDGLNPGTTTNPTLSLI